MFNEVMTLGFWFMGWVGLGGKAFLGIFLFSFFLLLLFFLLFFPISLQCSASRFSFPFLLASLFVSNWMLSRMMNWTDIHMWTNMEMDLNDTLISLLYSFFFL